MKNTRSSPKREIRVEVKAASDQPGTNVSLDPFDTTLLGSGIPNYALDPSTVGDFPPLATADELAALARFDEEHPQLRTGTPQSVREVIEARNSRCVFYDGEGKEKGFRKEDAWIQTHSGRRFTPTNPNPDAIVIQDIAHALSMQCRFSGHSKYFYSVAQHSVLVSYICDSQDALWGLLHDASEAYLVDVPRPIKRSGQMQAYIDFEHKVQEAVCRRFGLPMAEPPSVKKADTALLYTEARDLMAPFHSDWEQKVDPLPFLIEPWEHNRAKDMFMKRFFVLTTGDSAQIHYDHYLKYRDQL
jgi:uncharacterized protein